MSTEVPDGATQRHSRLMEMLTFINLRNGATITQIQSHMFAIFGLKFKTTSEMVQEAAVSGAIKADGHGFYHLTEKEQQAYKRMLAKERTENLVDPLTKRIDKIKDDKTRRRLLKLASELQTVLLETEAKQAEESE